MAIRLDAVHTGDCLEVLGTWPLASVDLIYLDPPFNTGKVHAASNGHYRDCWQDLSSYLAFMQPRVARLCELLKPTGSILLHCDWRTSHHFRLMLDDLLGPERFINHLIWAYGLGGSSPRRFARKHDDILLYGRTDAYYFEPPMVRATSRRMKGLNKKATDVLAIPAINNMATERCGYPTQKPLQLLDVLIKACCPRDGVVLDPFCGSGTTLVAAKNNQRRFVGIDINPAAVRLALNRCGVKRTLTPPRAPARRPARARRSGRRR